MPSSPAINIGIAIDNAKKKQLTELIDKAISRKTEKEQNNHKNQNAKPA
jgi:hypothetical protein